MEESQNWEMKLIFCFSDCILGPRTHLPSERAQLKALGLQQQTSSPPKYQVLQVHGEDLSVAVLLYFFIPVIKDDAKLTYIKHIFFSNEHLWISEI